jgi:hypothetical protein
MGMGFPLVWGGTGVSIAVTGFGMVGSSGEEHVWGEIDVSQTPAWSVIDDSQTPGWGTIDVSQSPNWTDIAV